MKKKYIYGGIFLALLFCIGVGSMIITDTYATSVVDGVLTATFNANGGSTTKTTTCSLEAGASGCYVTTPTAPTRTGYTFKGWSKGSTACSSSSITTDPSYYITSDTTYYACWQIHTYTYTVTYNNNGGSGCSTKSVTYGYTYGTLCTPTRTGYTFIRWKNSAGTTITSSSTVSTTRNCL